VTGLFTAAARVQTDLEKQGWPFCFIGGIALQHWGEPRVTRDIDIAIFTGFGGEATVINALLGMYPARITDARNFAIENRVLLLRFEDGPDIDIVLAALPFEEEMISRSELVEILPTTRIRLCAAEDLFVMKAFADRPQDRADLIGIAQRRGRILDWEAIIERLTPLSAARDAPHILINVEELRKLFAK
jgi:hypothetical protein